MNRTTTAAILAVVLAGALTACSGDLKAQDASSTTPAASAEHGTTPASDPTTTTAAPAKQAKAEEGTFKNPFPKGAPVGNDEVKITLGEMQGFLKYKEANMFNDDPKAGSGYFNVPVTVENLNADKISPAFDVTVKIVAPTGESYEEAMVTQDNELMNVSELYPGGSGTGVVCFELPTSVAATPGLMATISYRFGDEVFVTL